MTSLQKDQLGRLGFGAGGLWASELVSDDDADSLTRTALNLGIRYFDTGPTYGAGQAELRLVRGLASQPGTLISTKVGTHCDSRGRLYKDYTRDAILRSLDRSLKRLRRSSVDLVLSHGPTRVDDLTDDLIQTMHDLKSAGLTRAIGASCDGEVAASVITRAGFDAVMMTVNVLRPHTIAVAELANERSMIVIAKSPLAHARFTLSSLLPTGRRQLWYLGRTLRHYPRDIINGLRLGPLLSEAGSGSPAAGALKFLLSHSCIACAVVGTTSTAHLRELASAARTGPLPVDMVEAVRERVVAIRGHA